MLPIIILVILVIIFLIWAFLKFYYGATASATCSLQKRALLADKCVGGCQPGYVCISTAERPYGWKGILGTQDAICNCVPEDWAAGLADSPWWPHPSPPGSSDSEPEDN